MSDHLLQTHAACAVEALSRKQRMSSTISEIWSTLWEAEVEPFAMFGGMLSSRNQNTRGGYWVNRRVEILMIVWFYCGDT